VDVPLAEDDAEVGRVPGEEHLPLGDARLLLCSTLLVRVGISATYVHTAHIFIHAAVAHI